MAEHMIHIQNSLSLPYFCPCTTSITLCENLYEFMTHVPDVKEESITDYLVWQWRRLDTRFRYVSVNTFNRMVEHSTTGADFEFELWLIGSRTSIPLLFQAKKFIKPYNSYVRQLQYPDGTQEQLKKLLDYAKKNRRIPLYAIYTTGGNSATTHCGMYILSAKLAKEFAEGKHGIRLSLSRILCKSIRFYDIFCGCPKSSSHSFKQLIELLANLAGMAGTISDLAEYTHEDMPPIVQQLLDAESSSVFEVSQNLSVVRKIGIYDLRSLE